MTPAIGFGPFRLDPENADLSRGGEPVALRPKTYSVLLYLAERPGRLVTKDELLDAVWPDIEVGDGALKVCMAELRKALGDSAHAPTFIETVHRRGYRFIAKTSAKNSDEWRVTSDEQGIGDTSGLVTHHLSLVTAVRLVGREGELADLQAAMRRAMGGQRQIIFVTGEPGIGKTTVVEAFLDRAVRAHGGLWVARGQCVEQYGTAEAYLPVLEGLARLCRQPGGERVVTLLREHAPSWLMQLPGLLRAADREALQREYAGGSRERMLRELVVGLEALTADTPMVLVLEDLHWSDHSTRELLAALARRQESVRLLVLGTYRPADMLAAAVQELKVHRQCAEVALPGLSADAVAAYLATRFPDSSFAEDLAPLIHRSTDGNPLFMVNATDHLVAHGMIGRSAGTWVLQVDLAAVAREVPHSLRQMIQTQLGALSPPALRLLEAASAVGVEFSAPAVAAALEDTAHAVEDSCTALVQQGLLRRNGEDECPDAGAAARYAFTHELYQTALYERLTPARRARLHRSIGGRLETGYGNRTADIAAELAMHFERAHDHPRAITYYRQAGTSAVQRHAYHEAIVQLTRALDLLESEPGTPERDARELELQVSLGVPQLNTKGFAAPEVERTYARALQLCRRIGETPQLFQVLEGLHSFYAVRGDLPTAYDLAQQLLRLGTSTGESVQLLEAHHTLGCSEFWRGDLPASRAHFDAAIALYDPQQSATAFQQSGHDPKVCCLSNLGVTLWFAGYADQGLQRAQEAVAWAETLRHPDSLALARAVVAWVHLLRGENQRAQKSADATVELAREHGLPYWGAQATILRGSALARQGDATEGEKQLRRGLSGYESMGAGVARTEYLALRADLCARAGRHADGLQALDAALGVVSRQGERYLEAELLRLQGELLLQSGSTATPTTAHPSSEAEDCFRGALDIARRQQAKALELRAARSLSRLWSRCGQREQARQMLADVYAWFSEGFDTTDLRQARTLLDELSASR